MKEITEQSIRKKCEEIISKKYEYSKSRICSINVDMENKKISISIWDKDTYKDIVYAAEKQLEMAKYISKQTGFETKVSL